VLSLILSLTSSSRARHFSADKPRPTRDPGYNESALLMRQLPPLTNDSYSISRTSILLNASLTALFRSSSKETLFFLSNQIRPSQGPPDNPSCLMTLRFRFFALLFFSRTRLNSFREPIVFFLGWPPFLPSWSFDFSPR